MPRFTDLRIADTKAQHRYRELYYKCLQYPEWKERLAALTDSVKAISTDGQPHGNGVGNPTEEIAIKRAALSGQIEIVEETLHEVCDLALYPFMLLNVTRAVPYECLENRLGKIPPVGRRRFYEIRKTFFKALDAKYGEKGNASP